MKFLFVLFLAFFGCLAFGQEVPPVMPTEDFLKLLFASLGGLKGAGALAIAAVVVQLIIRGLNLPIVDGLFTKLAGTWKLAIVFFLTLVSGVLGLMVSGVSLGAALVHSATLSAFMVLANEVYKHFVKEPAK